MYPSRSDHLRSETAIGILLELIPIFEAEAVYAAAESSRALIAALRDWDIDSLWRHFTVIESAWQPRGIPEPGRVSQSDRLVRLASALRMISLDLLAQPEANAHN